MKPTMGGNRDGVMALDAVHLNIFAWNKKLTKYVRDGKLEKAIQLFQWMQREGMNLNIYSLLFRWLMHVLVWVQVNVVSMFMNRSFKMVVSYRSLWILASLTCMQNVGALKMFKKCTTSCHLEMWLHGIPWYWDMKCGQGQKALELFWQIQLYGNLFHCIIICTITMLFNVVMFHYHSLHSTCTHIVMAENAIKSTMVEGNKCFIKEFDHATNDIIPSKFNFKKFKIDLKNCYDFKIDITIEELNK